MIRRVAEALPGVEIGVAARHAYLSHALLQHNDRLYVPYALGDTVHWVELEGWAYVRLHGVAPSEKEEK